MIPLRFLIYRKTAVLLLFIWLNIVIINGVESEQSQCNVIYKIAYQNVAEYILIKNVILMCYVAFLTFHVELSPYASPMG